MFSKTLTDGRTATVTRDAGTWTVTIDGEHYTTGTLRQLTEPKGPATHVIGTSKVIGFTAAEAAELQAILDAEQAAYRATPAARHTILSTEADLAAGAARQAREHASNTGDWTKVGPAEKKIAAAEEALAAFDAEHPEFAAAEAAERAAIAEENIRAALNN